MFFAWGSGTKSVDAIRDFGIHHCPICNNNQTFKVVLNYGYAQLWYLFRCVTSRKYFAVCNRCGNGHVVEFQAISEKLVEDPAAFMDRRGWMVGVCAFGVIGVIVYVSNKEDDRINTEFAAAPKVGDIYSADLSRFSESFEGTPAYGLMRLSAINGDALSFQIARSAYNKTTGLHKDLSDKAFAKKNYFSEETAIVKQEEIRKFLDSKVVSAIRRDSK